MARTQLVFDSIRRTRIALDQMILVASVGVAAVFGAILALNV
jgi:hypothetical protein